MSTLLSARGLSSFAIFPLLMCLSGCGNEVHHAAWDGDLAAVKDWIEKGGDVNAKHTISGGNLLSYAAGGGNVELVEYLISKRASVHACDSNGATPLHFAARECHPAVTRVLITARANPNVRADCYKRSYSESHTAAMDFPFEGAPLHWAICSRGKQDAQKEATVKVLLESGADPNASGDRVPPPLDLAVLYRNPAIARMLIDKGADANAGFALHQAIFMDDCALVKLLIERGCDVNKSASSQRRFQPLDEIVGQPVALGRTVETPLKIAKSDAVRRLLKEAGARD